MRVQIRVMYDVNDRVEAGSISELLNAIRKLEAETAAALPSAELLPPAPAPLPPDHPSVIKANRQAAAAKARAAKEQKSRVGPVTSVLGPDEAGQPNGEDQDQDDDMGLVPPSMSPGEAKDAGLALVREAYAAGHVAQVKALQKKWGVAKFYDVDVTKGNVFYQDVMRMAVDVGIRQ